MNTKAQYRATFFALLAAALYAIGIPFSKILLNHIDPTMMAALLYLGAGFGLFICKTTAGLVRKGSYENKLTKKELPYTISMILLDIAAPIMLMFGIKYSSAANVSLINNFEIVATSLIALFVFKEFISKKLWLAIIMVTTASAILSFENPNEIEFNIGSIFVLIACVCWGFENNCTKMLSNKNPVEIVIIKGIFSGIGSLIVAFIMGETFPLSIWLICALPLGFVAYGLSIYFYILAQKHLGAAKTSAFYSIAPFLGVMFSLIFLNEKPAIQFYIALILMIASTFIMINDTTDSKT